MKMPPLPHGAGQGRELIEKALPYETINLTRKRHSPWRLMGCAARFRFRSLNTSGKGAPARGTLAPPPQRARVASNLDCTTSRPLSANRTEAARASRMGAITLNAENWLNLATTTRGGLS